MNILLVPLSLSLSFSDIIDDRLHILLSVSAFVPFIGLRGPLLHEGGPEGPREDHEQGVHGHRFTHLWDSSYCTSIPDPQLGFLSND